MSTLFDDVRHAVRGLRRSPALTAVAVVSLAIGIGANAAIFGLMDRVLFRSLPVRDPGQLVLLRSPGGWTGSVDTNYGDAVSLSWPKYRALQEQTGAWFDGLLARAPFPVSIAAGGQPESAQCEMVSGNYFEVLGVRPALGRLLEPEDTAARGGNHVAVLSYGFWKSRLGGDERALNRTVSVNGVPLTVVGVTQPGFRSIGAGEAPAVFVPVVLLTALNSAWPADTFENPHSYWLNVFARLKPGFDGAHAAAGLAPVWHGILEADSRQLPAGASRDKYLRKPLELAAGGNGISSIRSDFEPALWLLMGMVGLVLLIACANIANLLLARALARSREVAIRLSLGASRGRLMRHVLLESVVLSLTGGAFGLLVATWAGHLLLDMAPDGLPLAGVTADVDGRILLFTFAVSAVTGLLFGCVPAWQATRTDVAPVLKEGIAQSTGNARFRRALVAGQIAISALMLASAGLLTHSLRNLNRLDPGFRAGGVETFAINPRLLGYGNDRARRLAEDVRTELGAAAGIMGVATAKWPLLANTYDQRGMEIEGYVPPEGRGQAVADNHVSPGFFSTLGLPLIAGREFLETDVANAAGVAVVNQSFARKYYPDRSPIGMHVKLRRTADAFQIVGVVRDAKYDDLRESPKPFVYFAAGQDRQPGATTFYVRSRMSRESLSSAIRATVRRLDGALPVEGPHPFEQQIRDSIFVDRMVATLAIAFAAIATALAAIGLYGVMAWAISRRRREIGIRMALGAAPGAIVRMVFREVAWLGLAGVLIAAPLWFVAGGLLKALLFGVGEFDPAPLLGAVALLVLAAGVAGLVPAWRAARLDPNTAIRQD